MLLRTLAILLNHGDFAKFLFDHLSPVFTIFTLFEGPFVKSVLLSGGLTSLRSKA